jgi:hypothetical protein
MDKHKRETLYLLNTKKVADIRKIKITTEKASKVVDIQRIGTDVSLKILNESL